MGSVEFVCYMPSHAVVFLRYSRERVKMPKWPINEGRGNMNTKVRYLTIIAAGMLMTTNPTVADELVLVGPGALSCGKIIADIEDDKTFRTTYFFWAQGFLSGLNLKYFQNWQSATDLSDPDALKLWIQNYCEENPLDVYVVAASQLWNELRARQGLEPDRRGIQKD